LNHASSPKKGRRRNHLRWEADKWVKGLSYNYKMGGENVGIKRKLGSKNEKLLLVHTKNEDTNE
jgi:hypothetical protein